MLQRTTSLATAVSLGLILVQATIGHGENSYSWTSADGGHTQEAEFIKLRGQTVVLRFNGKEKPIPLKNLDEASRALAARLAIENTKAVPTTKQSTPVVLSVELGKEFKLGAASLIVESVNILGSHATGGVVVEVLGKKPADGNLIWSIIHLNGAKRSRVATKFDASPDGDGLLESVALLRVNAAGQVLLSLEVREGSNAKKLYVWDGQQLRPVRVKSGPGRWEDAVLLDDGKVVTSESKGGDGFLGSTQFAGMVVYPPNDYLPTATIVCPKLRFGTDGKITLGNTGSKLSLVQPTQDSLKLVELNVQERLHAHRIQSGSSNGRFVLSPSIPGPLFRVDAVSQQMQEIAKPGPLRGIDGLLRSIVHATVAKSGDVYAVANISPHQNPNVQLSTILRWTDDRAEEITPRINKQEGEFNAVGCRGDDVIILRSTLARERELVALRDKKLHTVFNGRGISGFKTADLVVDGHWDVGSWRYFTIRERYTPNSKNNHNKYAVVDFFPED